MFERQGLHIGLILPRLISGEIGHAVSCVILDIGFIVSSAVCHKQSKLAVWAVVQRVLDLLIRRISDSVGQPNDTPWTAAIEFLNWFDPTIRECCVEIGFPIGIYTLHHVPNQSEPEAPLHGFFQIKESFE